MQKLIINNFISIKEMEIELTGFTVLIGRQASGKSIVAKLSYFFREFVTEALSSGIRDNQRKPSFDKELIEKFCDLFVKDMWNDKPFDITFVYSDTHSITLEKSTAKSNVKIILHDNTSIYFTQGKKKFLKYQNGLSQDQVGSASRMFQDFKFKELLYFAHARDLQGFDAYIPASRAFFSTLSDNIFSLLTETGRLEPMLSEFGSIYSFAKDINDNKLSKSMLNSINKDMTPDIAKIIAQVDSLSYKILNGKLKTIKGEDYLETGSKDLKLIYASSGQQESLPLLVSLRMLPTFWRNTQQQYYVEEPEAHLFPEAQYDIIKIIALIRNAFDKSSNFLLTTHSPYVLSAINNLIYIDKIANSTSDGAEKLKAHDFNIHESIPFQDVRAYSIDNGLATPILDHESELIDASLIDSVSNVFADEFDTLLDLAYED
ncbi:hypothetical protein A9266_18390 [Vibrio tasmaniensis]|nr:hypothetical protein A9266_18390 [Vibrio tasmaniensis]